MATKTKYVDWGGLTPIVSGIRVGASKPGQLGSELTGTEIALLDGITAGTAAASKAVVLGASKEIATITTATITNLTSTTITPTTIAGAANFTGTPTFAAGATISAGDLTLGVAGTINLDSAVQSLTSNAVTATKYAVQITSEALTTAAGASQAFVITLTGAAATDLAFVTPCGGTNTRQDFTLVPIMTTNTCTVTLYNNEPVNAINGTVKFNLWILKA